jgi:hypothetical protein
MRRFASPEPVRRDLAIGLDLKRGGAAVSRGVRT